MYHLDTSLFRRKKCENEDFVLKTYKKGEMIIVSGGK